MNPQFSYVQVCEPWRIIPVLVLILGVFSLNHFRFLDVANHGNDNRMRSIDGLRGFLALGVFFTHATAYYAYVLKGEWTAGPSLFFNQLGSVSVSLFFIITSYLFWGRAVASSNSIRNMRGYGRYLFSLYLSRFFRIAPLYYFVVALMLIIVLFVTGPHLNVSALKCTKEVINWMLLGLGALVSVNGYRETSVMLIMAWTLRWKWYFYFSLAATSCIAFSTRLRLPFSLIIFFISTAFLTVDPSSQFRFALYFSTGMIFASLPPNLSRSRIPEPLQSFAAAVLIGLAYFGFEASQPVMLNIVLAAFFYLIANGCDIFGLLKTRAAQRLGAISYSVYLVHGICLHVVFSNTALRTFAFESITYYWGVVLLTALMVTYLSSLTFALIERRGIRFGRRVLGRTGLSRANWGVKPASVT